MSLNRDSHARLAWEHCTQPLKGLEDKGLLKSFAGDTTEERAGRPKRYFEITALGKKAMQYTKETRDALWKAIPKTVWEAAKLVRV